MKRTLLQSSSFVRTARNVVKKRLHIEEELRTALELLSEDAFHPKLKSHKLKGYLDGSWACSVGYDLRIIFDFVQHEGSECILLQTVGTHDEVY